MLSTNRAKWIVRIALAVSIVVILTSAGGVAAAPKCRKIGGSYTAQAVAGPDCLSPIGFCAARSYKGDVAGDSAFTGSSLIQTADTPTTGVVLVTGDNLIRTKDGDLLTKDAMVLRTTGDGDFAGTETVVGGTGIWSGVTGHLNATGTFTAATGGEAKYTGSVCAP